MREFGLIGYPLGHSYSQKYFTEKFSALGIADAKYSTFPISEISKINNIVASNKSLLGINVTTPYKELIIPYLDELDIDALKLGNVNTIKIYRDDNNIKLKGFNTDIFGLQKTINKFDLPDKIKALILGSGGSAKTVAYLLNSKGIKYIHVSRNPSKPSMISYSALNRDIINDYKLIINASPVGMHPNKDKCPDIPYEMISTEHFAIDLVYNPENTLFLLKCRDKGAYTENGLTMLYEQADKAWEIWTNDNY